VPSSPRPDPAADDADRWIVVDGRRWRATDPAIPDGFRTELVAELMDARRAVGAALRTDAADDLRRARARVQDAKVALGERGAAWWLEATPAQRDERLTAAIRSLARHRGPDRSICPSDAARIAGGDGWRSLLDEARAAARNLARAGEVEVLQKGQPVDLAAQWRGPIRIRMSGRPAGAAPGTS
jgi:hypothetical protein